MAAIGASAVGAVALITSQLGARRQPAPAVNTPAPSPDGVLPVVPAADPGAQPQDATEPVKIPVLITREQWGAKPPRVTPGGGGENGPYDAFANPNGWLVYDRPLDEIYQMIIIHHSALPLSDGPLEIQRLHQDEFGFADIGYQYLIDERGQVVEGRALDVRGAHTLDYNYGSLGVCLIGNFEEIEPTGPQLHTLGWLLDDLLARYPRISRLAGHKDCNPGRTLCPGKNLHPLLPGMAEARKLAYGPG